MKTKPSAYIEVAGAGSGIIGTLVVGLFLGFVAAKYLHWVWAVPIGLILGFAAGIVSAYRRLSSKL